MALSGKVCLSHFKTSYVILFTLLLYIWHKVSFFKLQKIPVIFRYDFLIYKLLFSIENFTQNFIFGILALKFEYFHVFI